MFERIVSLRSGAATRPAGRSLSSQGKPCLQSIFLLAGVIVAIAACAPGPAAPRSATASPSPLPVADAAGFANATCIANKELGLGFGNPDSNVKSVAWKAFDAATAAKNPTQLAAAADAVLVHLEAARVANDQGATWAPGATASADFAIVLVGLEKYIVTVREARGEPVATAQAE